MPNIRIMNWNIERLSANKTGIGNLATNMGKVIATAHNPAAGGPWGADIAIILEVTAGTAATAMTALSAAANAASVALGGNANDYTGWFLSYPTGGECYGVLIKDLNQVRPIHVAAGPDGSGAIPYPNDPEDPSDLKAYLTSLDGNQFSTWPGTFAGTPNAYPVPGHPPRLPLTDVYSRSPPAGRKRRRFSGQTLGTGGYALGRGFRMPCLMMFEILAAFGANTVVPILACHLGAVRGGANPLARGQFGQYKATHIAEKYSNPPALALPGRSYIDLNGAATRIQELIVTGDFNIDFEQQNPPPPANALRTGNRNAFNTVTPTTWNGGSAAPPANPGPAGVVPAVPFANAYYDSGPIANVIPDQTLKTANTSSGTILHHFPVLGAATTQALRGAAFDNFFFGGTQLNATYQAIGFAAVGDAGFVHDVPAQIVQGPAANATLNVSAEWAHYAAANTKDANNAPNLNPVALPALTMNDRLIGARFISDHLPVVVQFNLP